MKMTKTQKAWGKGRGLRILMKKQAKDRDQINRCRKLLAKYVRESKEGEEGPIEADSIKSLREIGAHLRAEAHKKKNSIRFLEKHAERIGRKS
jgi:hypothetical protein